MYFSPLAMREVVAALGPRTRDALGALLPGPVTLVVANPERLYPLACREDPERLGLRLIGGPLAGAACAIFQTSANRSGERAPARFADVDPAIAAVDLAIDGGELTGLPSTVVDMAGIERGDEPAILREGALSRESARRLEPLETVKNSSEQLPPPPSPSPPRAARCRSRSCAPGPGSRTRRAPAVAASSTSNLDPHRFHHLEERLPPPADALGAAIDVRLARNARRRLHHEPLVDELQRLLVGVRVEQAERPGDHLDLVRHAASMLVR